MKKPILLVLIIFLAISCKKDDGPTTSPKPVDPIGIEDDEQGSNPDQEPEPVIEGGLTVSQDGINTTQFQLIVDTLATGVTKINLGATTLLDSIKVGSVLMDNEIGYLVKVTEKEGNDIIFENASLDDYFIDGKISFSSNDSSSGKFISETGKTDFSFDYNQELFNNGTSSIGFSGSLQFNPEIKSEIDFGNKTFDFSISNAPMTLTGNLNIVIAGETTGEKLIEVGVVDKTILYGVLLVTFRVTIYDKIQLTASGIINENIEANSSFNVNASLAYDQAFSESFSFVNTDNNLDVNLNGEVNLNIKHEIVPKLEVLFYKVAGPYMEFSPYDNWNASATTEGVEELNWDFYGEKGMDFRLGVSTRLFAGLSKEYTWPITEPIRFYEMPKDLKLISEENISGSGDEEIDGPIRIEVLDSRENRVAGVLVYGEITEGTGELVEAKVFTNSNGIAEFRWKLGCEENQKVEFSVKKADKSILNDKKLTVNASVEKCIALSITPDALDFGEVGVGTPSERTFVITNNLEEAIQILPLTTTESEVTTDWASGGTLGIGQSRTITATFTPTTNTTSINGSISIETEDGSGALNVNYTGAKKENNEVDLEGLWRFTVNTPPTGTSTIYNPDGRVIVVSFEGGFLSGVNFTTSGDMIVPNDPEVATYSQSEGSISIDVIYDRGQILQIFSFSGSWDENVNAYVGSGTLKHTQWYSSERGTVQDASDATFQQMTFKK